MSETSVNKYQHTLRKTQEERRRPFWVISTGDIEAQLYPEIPINTVITNLYFVWTYKAAVFIYVCCTNLFVELNIFL
jgi:hypothetical protein